MAFLFGGMALVFLIRELDYFLDRFVADNLWQVLIAIVGALIMAYTYRHIRRLRIALARIWPSPAVKVSRKSVFCSQKRSRNTSRRRSRPRPSRADSQIRHG